MSDFYEKLDDPRSPIKGVPMVRVVDEEGNVLFRGWYVFHQMRQLGAFDDELKEADVAHLVVHDRPADWNMPRNLVITEVTPPHRIEVINE